MFFRKFKKFYKISAYSSYNEQMNNSHYQKSFWNHTFDKGRLKNFVLWFLKNHGEHKTVRLVEELKNVGFQYATKAGISLGIEDLKIPEKKYSLMMDAEQLSIATIKQYKRGEITGVERFQRLIDTWHRTSEGLKQEVIDNFEATDVLNPVYMMAFSGARGNISQVRQLVGMRGLMSDPQGQIIDFPIRSNFREGLTLTEYIISSYGARKGIVDTALRTANAGYLTRRLVDVAQHVIISSFDCGTKRGIFLTDMKEGNKIIYSLQNRLVGRVLARDIVDKQKNKIASRNSEISIDLANQLSSKYKKVFVRSSLTCSNKKLVCQLCYGWSLAQGNLVPIGEAVGVVAAQSIGEPGTQLTMRTFHTGGVFSGDVSDQIRSPFNGIVEYDSPIAGNLIRTPEGKIAFLTKNEGSFMVHRTVNGEITEPRETKRFKIPFYTLLFLKHGSISYEKEVIAQISSINRQKNATDQVELTIKSELSGQFYSKFLDLKENKVGPKLKNTENSGDTLTEQFNENAVDTIFEAWGWGYAWVLSGKIYQIGLPSLIFPIIGDFLNKKTYMNQIQWNLPTSFGSLFKLNLPKQQKFFNQTSKKSMRQFNSKNLSNSILLNHKHLFLLKSQLISFQLSKITYKDLGYFLKLGSPLSSFNINVNNKPFDDTLFLFSSLFSNPSGSSEYTESLNPKNIKNDLSVYPVDWEPSFDVFVKWFPKAYSTKNAGLILTEPDVPKIHSKKLLKKWKMKKSSVSLKSIHLIKEYEINSKHKLKLKTLSNFNSEILHFSEKMDSSNNKLKIASETSLIKFNKNTIKFFPSFIRTTRFEENLNKSDSQTLNVSGDRLSNLSQNLIFEQYFQPPLSKNLGSKTSKNKLKGDFSKLNLMWQNRFKIELHKFSKSNKKFTHSQDFKKMFWVSQPFFSLSKDQLKRIIFNRAHFFSLERFLSASIYDTTQTNKKDIFYQMNRQGKVKVFQVNESFIQVDKSLQAQSFKPKSLDLLNEFFSIKISKLYAKFPFIRFTEKNLLNHGLNFKFTSFRFTLKQDLKERQKNILSLKTLLDKKQKIINVNELTLKSFSKLSSMPYFLNKKASILFRNYLIERNSAKKLKIKNLKDPLKLSLFDLYMYSLGNKDWFYFDPNLSKNKHPTKIRFNQISSFYLKDQFLFSHFMTENMKFNKTRNLILLKILKSENHKKHLLYEKRSDSYVFQDLSNSDFFYPPLIYSQSHSNEITKERICEIHKWFKTSKSVRKIYLKKFLKLNKELYKKFFKDSSLDVGKKPLFMPKQFKISKLFSKPRRKINPGSASLTKTLKNQPSNLNLVLKSGWIYLPKNLSDFLFYHKILLNPGRKLNPGVIFSSGPLYIEIVSLHRIESYLSLVNHFLIHHQDLKDLHFKSIVRNDQARFNPEIKGKDHDSYFLLVQKTIEYKLIKKLDQKKYLFSFSNQLSISPTLYNLNHGLSHSKKPLFQSTKKMMNKSFNTLNTYFQFKTSLLNKQQITSQGLSKWPSADLKLVSNHNLYASFMNLSMQEKSDSGSSKLNPQKLWYLPQIELRSLKSLNLASMMVSYNVPYSFYFPFKTPLHLFGLKQDKSFFNQKVVFNSKMKNILYSYVFKIHEINLELKTTQKLHFQKNSLWSLAHFNRNLSALFCCPIAEYSLGSQFERSLSVPNSLMNSHKNSFQNLIWNLNHVKNPLSLKFKNQKILSSLEKKENDALYQNQELSLYKTDFSHFSDYSISPQTCFFKTSTYCSFEGEFIYKTTKAQKAASTLKSSFNFSAEKNVFHSLFDQKSMDYGCMILTKNDQVSFYFATETYKEAYSSLEKLKNKTQYKINDLVIHFLNVSEQNQKNLENPSSSKTESLDVDKNSVVVQINKLPAGMSQQRSKLLLGDFLVYGDQISPNLAVSKSGQIIHLNNHKVTLRQGQPIFVSPKAVLHKYDGDFIDPHSSVITLSYQQLKTGDIIQGIPKVEQFFEARTTKRGRLFRDSLSNLLKGLFKRYRSRLPFDQAVRQSFYKIQQIIVDGVQRVYRSQGVTISDKHLEIIVKQMTSKVRIIEGGQTGFFPGEIVDLDFVEYVNSLLIKTIVYEPLVLGITKSSLEVNSFLSAASFQQTTRVLSKAAVSRKKDFLKGLKENVILGNLIPAGTGYLVYLDSENH